MQAADQRGTPPELGRPGSEEPFHLRHHRQLFPLEPAPRLLLGHRWAHGVRAYRRRDPLLGVVGTEYLSDVSDERVGDFVVRGRPIHIQRHVVLVPEEFLAATGVGLDVDRGRTVRILRRLLI